MLATAMLRANRDTRADIESEQLIGLLPVLPLWACQHAARSPY